MTVLAQLGCSSTGSDREMDVSEFATPGRGDAASEAGGAEGEGDAADSAGGMRLDVADGGSGTGAGGSDGPTLDPALCERMLEARLGVGLDRDADGAYPGAAFEGVVVASSSEGRWELDACPCGAQCIQPDPWTLSVDVEPGLGPELAPGMCLRAELIETGTASEPLPTAVVLWEQRGGDDVLLYVAASAVREPAALEGNLEVSLTPEAFADCDEGTATRFEARFRLGQHEAVLREGEAAPVGTSNYQAVLLQALSLPPEPRINADWVLRLR